MPKAIVISTYLDPDSGRYVMPPAEVDLTQERFEHLKRAKCVKGKAGRKPRKQGEGE